MWTNAKWLEFLFCVHASSLSFSLSLSLSLAVCIDRVQCDISMIFVVLDCFDVRVCVYVCLPVDVRLRAVLC